jgi:hypothetical protein
MHAEDSAPNAAPEPPPERLRILAERLIRTLAVGRALVITGRSVDMSGIQDGIGVLCAKSLDLPRDQGRQMLPMLLELAAQVDSLSMAMRRLGGG